MIYYDNAATTKMYDECADIIREYGCNKYFNPSALYNPSIDIMKALIMSRKTIADIIDVDQDEIYFTGSGTEADNLALFGTKKRRNSNIIISSIEHSAVYKASMYLKEQGYEIRMAPVNCYGAVDFDEYIRLVDENTSLVSIMNVSNETGAINDIYKLSKAAKEINKNIIFHSDGVQALGKQKVKLRYTDIDLYSMSAHKIHGPKGVGALYVKKGVNINSILKGGEQERGVRPSTENVGGIVAFAKALELFTNNKNYHNNCYEIKHKIEYSLSNSIDKIKNNSPYDVAANNILNLALYKVNSETLLHALEKYEIYIGVGSACTSKSREKRAANALNLGKEYSDGMVRLSFSDFNSLDEVDYFTKSFIEAYNSIIKK